MKTNSNKNGFLLASALALTLALAFLSACTWETTIGCDTAALITAINNANADADTSTIRLNPDCIYTFTEAHTTITTYFDGSPFEYGSVALPPITTPIVIDGNHATLTRADTASEFRFFFITGEGNLTLNDVTITNGSADASIGGGVDSTFPGSGGAIYNDGAYLEINRSTIQDNAADYYGGAIFTIHNATTHVNDSIISDNSADSGGGGIYVYHGGLFSIANSTIQNNTSSTDGGGINLEHGAELVVSNSTIEANHASRRGGGIFKDGAATRLPTTITGTTFQNNTADWGGGGIFIWRTPLSIADSRFLGNQAGENGGGLAYQNNSTETVLITNTTFDSNTAVLGGGGIHFSGELMTIKVSAFQNNQAENGGAIHNAASTVGHDIIRADTTMIVIGSKIQDNAAIALGGGIYNDGLLTINESNVSDNRAPRGGGGIFNRGEITAQDSTFSGNATDWDGGGLWNTSHGSAKVTGSTFTSNTSRRGGGLASIGAEATIVNSTISGNTASDTGGGIFNMGISSGDTSAGGAMFASHVTIAHNSAPTGGDIAASGGQLKIKNSIVAYSHSGSDCVVADGSDIAVDGENLDTDGSCPGFTMMEDPLLNSLADNGGPTFTHALNVGSPAIDAAPDCITLGGVTLLVDQRGRPRRTPCDLGAYETDPEFQAPTPEALQENTPTPEPTSATAIQNANCRYGPGTAYDIADTLFEGQTALVQGRNEAKTWWQIKGPKFGTLCWVSYVTVKVNGDPDKVPIQKAPPLPEEPPAAKPQGCYVYDQYQNVICTVPCPPNPQPGGACTP